MILLDLMIALTFTMSLFALLLTLKPGRLFKFGKWPFFFGFHNSNKLCHHDRSLHHYCAAR